MKELLLCHRSERNTDQFNCCIKQVNTNSAFTLRFDIVFFNMYFNLLQDMDEVSGKFSIVTMLTLVWQDQTLTWDSVKYGHVGSLMLPINDIWHPKLVLMNPSSNIDNMVQDWMSARVLSIGYVVFVPVTTIHSTCGVDITYFPFDTQVS